MSIIKNAGAFPKYPKADFCYVRHIGVSLIPYQSPIYELVKPVSIKALESAGFPERELHRFAFLLLKATDNTTCWCPSSQITIERLIDIASQCSGGLEWLKEKGFIRLKEPELKPCPFCGSKANKNFFSAICNWIECPHCGANNKGECGFTFVEDAIIRWNTRA